MKTTAADRQGGARCRVPDIIVSSFVSRSRRHRREETLFLQRFETSRTKASLRWAAGLPRLPRSFARFVSDRSLCRSLHGFPPSFRLRFSGGEARPRSNGEFLSKGEIVRHVSNAKAFARFHTRTGPPRSTFRLVDKDSSTPLASKRHSEVGCERHRSKDAQLLVSSRSMQNIK